MAPARRVGLLLSLLLPVVSASMPGTVVRLNRAVLSYGKRRAARLPRVTGHEHGHSPKRACGSVNSKAVRGPGFYLLGRCVPGPQIMADEVRLGKRLLSKCPSGGICPVCHACAHARLYSCGPARWARVGVRVCFCSCVSACKPESSWRCICPCVRLSVSTCTDLYACKRHARAWV